MHSLLSLAQQCQSLNMRARGQPPQKTGYSIGGQWKLQVDVNLPVKVRR